MHIFFTTTKNKNDSIKTDTKKLNLIQVNRRVQSGLANEINAFVKYA